MLKFKKKVIILNVSKKGYKMTNKKAFTLAEVLITLTIIGVVAALTIPAVVFSTDEKQAIVGLKKAILTLDQAVDMARTEPVFQPNPKCYVGENGEASNVSQCADLFKYMKDIMQVEKYCEEDPVAGKCAPSFAATDGSCDGWNKLSQAFVTADGMSFFVYNANDPTIIGVDINGLKSPNKWGHDIFSLQLTGTATTMQSYRPGGCEYAVPTGKTGSQLLEESDED